MASIICITGYYDKCDVNGIPTGRKELLVSHGINADTDSVVILPQIHPHSLGAVFNPVIGEYVIEDKE